jgi:hypothetical protein
MVLSDLERRQVQRRPAATNGKTMKPTITIINLSVVLACPILLAQTPSAAVNAGAEQRFKQFDKNGDGKITREESGNAGWFDTLDRNHDGVVTLEETKAAAAFGASRGKRGSAAGSASDELQKAIAYRKDSAGPVPLSDSKAFTDLRFTRDWIPGTKDRSGKLMTGTECNYIVAHGGRLYAAVSLWNHDPAAPNPGPGVLVKKSAAAPWEVDVQFAPPSVRVAVLASLTFTTDAKGTALAKAVTLLVAGGSVVESRTEMAVFIRDDAAGKWVKSVLAERGARDIGEVRQLAVHRDRVTGADRLITAITNGKVFSGGYDPAAPGFIRWSPEPELTGRLGRIMSVGRVNGDAYLAVDITPDAPKNGGLFRRVDGPQPRWEWLGEWGHRIQSRIVAWIRAITAIPDPEHPGKEIFLCSRGVDGVIEIINPQRNHEARVEFDLRRHFGGLVGARDGQRFTTSFAYNEMTPAVHPDTGERVLLIAGGIMPGLPGDDPRSKCAWLLIRHADGRYASCPVFDPAVNPSAAGGLRSARTVCVSPFREDKGRVLYFGGFDASQGPHRDTAWIYTGTLKPKP